MINDAIKTNKNILFDHISQKEIINYMNTKKYNNLYIGNGILSPKMDKIKKKKYLYIIYNNKKYKLYICIYYEYILI